MQPDQIIEIEDAEWLGEMGADPSVPAPLAPEVPLQVIPPDREALLWGVAGVAVGSLVTGLLTALAFRSFARTQSPWGPALVSGVGAFVVGGTLIAVASRARDSRTAAAASGFKLAY